MVREEKKHPKVPTYPPSVKETVAVLNGMIASGGALASVAYATLSRIAVLWAPDTEPVDKTTMVNDLVFRLMPQLFPKGEGLPERDPL